MLRLKSSLSFSPLLAVVVVVVVVVVAADAVAAAAASVARVEAKRQFLNGSQKLTFDFVKNKLTQI